MGLVAHMLIFAVILVTCNCRPGRHTRIQLGSLRLQACGFSVGGSLARTYRLLPPLHLPLRLLNLQGQCHASSMCAGAQDNDVAQPHKLRSAAVHGCSQPSRKQGMQASRWKESC